MMSETSKRRTAIRIALLGSLALALAACDRREERVERAETVIEAAWEQVNGRDPRRVGPQDGPAPLASVPVEDRALAGTVQNRMVVARASESPRFAIGSVIAKPKNLPRLAPPSPELVRRQEMAELGRLPKVSIDPRERRERVVEGQAPERVIEKLQRADRAEVRELEVREMRPVEETGDAAPAPAPAPVDRDGEALEALEVLDRSAMKRLTRRAAVTPELIQVQADARTEMMDVMAEYGLGGTVELSRTGQMVIELGADPTQFTTEGATKRGLPRMALVRQEGCPSDIPVEEIRANPALATECVLERLRSSGNFEYVEKDYIFEHQFARRPETVPGTGEGGGTSGPIAAILTPNDPLWEMQWHFRDNGAEADQSPGGAGFVDFWSRTGQTGSSEVVVAVIDTGLQLDHPDIAGSPNIAPGWDMVSDPDIGNDGDGRDSDPNDPGDLCDPTQPFAEDTFHGTHVAGTIGAAISDNGAGVAGGAWNVKIVPVRALGKCGGKLRDINDAIRWAGGLVPAFDAEGNEVWNDNPADIINLSIGLFEFCPASLQEAIDEVKERGVIVVSAAGNAGVSTRYYAPAGCRNVVTVAAGDARGQIAPYSNYGGEVDILAPGGDLTRDDNNDGRPDGVLSTKKARNCYDPVSGEAVETCSYAFEHGTSMAAPHVSAAFALLRSQLPEATSDELVALLQAALEPRTPEQCAGDCSFFPGAEPIEGSDNLCRLPCGGGLLNLANLSSADLGVGE